MAFLASALLTWHSGLPRPVITDECSYLLAADTFAHGRLANPPHPHWRHFQAAHILQQPTYASKYPPGQGLFLAFGQVFFGHPIAGAWLSAALACAAICWMLQACVPPRWALIGSGVAIVRIVFAGGGGSLPSGFDGYWSQSYWGGAVAAIGGALLFGGWRRIVDGPPDGRRESAVWASLGVVLLANSRPYEGAVAAVVAAVGLVGFACGRKSPGRNVLLRGVLLPAALSLAVGAAATGFYNYRVTGDPWKMPYQVFDETYAMVSPFWWREAAPAIEYDDPGLRELRWMDDRIRETLRADFLAGLGLKLQTFGRFFLGAALSAACLATSPCLLRDRRIRFAWASLAVFAISLVPVTYFLPHYAAPVTAIVFLIVTQALRYLRAWRPRRLPRAGRVVFGLVMLATVAAAGWRNAVVPDPNAGQGGIERYLSEWPEKHLIIIQRPSDSIYVQFPRNYNGADIDHARFVWADDLGPVKNQELVDYFADRRVWRLRVGDSSLQIDPVAGPRASPGDPEE